MGESSNVPKEMLEIIDSITETLKAHTMSLEIIISRIEALEQGAVSPLGSRGGRL